MENNENGWSMPSGLPGAGWFADPAGSGRMRWWDGSSWTDRFAGEDGLSPFGPPATPAGGPVGPRRRSRKWPWVAGVGAAIVGLLVIAGLVGAPDDNPDRTVAATSVPPAPSTSHSSSTPHSSSSTSASAVASTTRMSSRDATIALGRLDDLEVKGRAPKTGYSREEFGSRWSDDVDVDGGHNGCDTRNDMLGSLGAVTFKPGTRECVVLTGTLHDPYTGRDIEFARGEKTSTAVQIDHLVALSDAWQKGAQRLTADERRNFANDPANLQPTDGPTNAAKSDGDAATWLPPSRSYRCTYVSRQIDVKTKYRLWVTAAEKSAMRRVLGTCGAKAPESDNPESDNPESGNPESEDRGDRTGTTDRTVVPDRSTATRTPRRVLETPTETVAPETTDEVTEVPETTEDTVDTTEDTGGSVYYANCSQVRAAGAAPIHAGDPGYSRKLDRDGDGVAASSPFRPYGSGSLYGVTPKTAIVHPNM